MIGKVVAYFGIRGFVLGCVLGAVYGTILVILLGTIYGALTGAVLGLIVGIIGGLIIGSITCRWFFPAANAQKYRRTVRVAGFVIALVGTGVGLGLFFGLDSRNWMSGEILGFVYIPAIIAAITGIFVSDRFAAQYLANVEELIGIDNPRRKLIRH